MDDVGDFARQDFLRRARTWIDRVVFGDGLNGVTIKHGEDLHILDGAFVINVQPKLIEFVDAGFGFIQPHGTTFGLAKLAPS